MLNPKEIKENAKKDWQRTWKESSANLPKESKKNYIFGRGKPHLAIDFINRVRNIFLNLGFDEVENPYFITEEDIYKQYGPESPVILDRCYYLAGLERPDIGLSNEKISEIKKIANIEIEELKKILREYREGIIEGDNILEEFMRRLKISNENAGKIINLFSEFKEIKPTPSKTLLRSHMTASWFQTISSLQDKREMPIKLFSVGVRFRREQKVDEKHLKAHYGASCIIVDEEINIKSGEEISKKILSNLGFKNFEFIKKKATSNYYAYDLEYEIFANGIEIADCGMYSPIALANYDIKYPVFNLGFGIERVLMVKKNIEDIRELIYPQFYEELKFNDKEIANLISFIKIPKTERGLQIAKLISENCLKYGKEKSPCEFKVYDGEFLQKKIEISLAEKEEGKNLCGPAFLNEIIVYDGNVYGLPKEEKYKEHFEKGIKKTTYLEGFSLNAIAEIENAIEKGEKEFSFSVKMVKLLSDINLQLDNKVRRFITANNKKIDVRGPLFIEVRMKVKV